MSSKEKLLLFFLIVSLFFNAYLFFKLNPSFLNFSNKNLVEDKVTKVIDGDTVDVVSGERIRFYEIDAPENPQGCLGTESKTRLENLIGGKQISYEKVGKDNFGRILAYVYVKDQLINQVLVEEGLAYFLKGKTLTEKSLVIEKAQENSRSLGRGVWSSLCQTQSPGCLIKGNYRDADNTRIYHLPICYNYAKISIRPGTSDRWFCTEDEAKAAGFIKSKDCPK